MVKIKQKIDRIVQAGKTNMGYVCPVNREKFLLIYGNGNKV